MYVCACDLIVCFSFQDNEIVNTTIVHIDLAVSVCARTSFICAIVCAMAMLIVNLAAHTYFHVRIFFSFILMVWMCIHSLTVLITRLSNRQIWFRNERKKHESKYLDTVSNIVERNDRFYLRLFSRSRCVHACSCHLPFALLPCTLYRITSLLLINWSIKFYTTDNNELSSQFSSDENKCYVVEKRRKNFEKLISAHKNPSKLFRYLDYRMKCILILAEFIRYIFTHVTQYVHFIFMLCGTLVHHSIKNIYLRTCLRNSKSMSKY